MPVRILPAFAPAIIAFNFASKAIRSSWKGLAIAIAFMRNDEPVVTRKLTLDGREYVLVPRDQWDKMIRRNDRQANKRLVMPGPSSDGTYTLDHVRISLANKMSSRRKSAGLTQAQLARLARVRVETISRLENGLHMPSAKTFDRIDRALTRAAKRPAA